MKILHLLPTVFGGIDTYVFSHYKYMNWAKFRFDLMTRNPAFQDAGQYRDYPYTVRVLPGTAAEDREGFIRELRKILGYGYDVLHLHTSYWTGTLIEEIAREQGIRKVIVHAHTTYVDVADDERRAELLRRHEAVKEALTPELATDYWACSRKAAEWLFGDRISGVRIMKNAFEVDRFRFNPGKRAEVRERLGLGESLVLGTVGRLSYQKNHAFLVDMFAEFHQRHPKSKLVIVGDGELRSALERQIAGLRLEGDVLLTGWRTDAEAYLQAMDVFLLPSRFEGLGIAVLEAAASGLPCVVSEQVPEEAVVSESIRRIPLSIPAWNAEVEELSRLPADRREGAAAVEAAGYDVRKQAKVLERLYEL